jgi:hypothetical protein
MDRWIGLYKYFFGQSSFVSFKQSGDLSTTSDKTIVQGSFVEERSIEERNFVWNAINSVTDLDDMCNSERGILGAKAAKKLLWEVHASCLRAKGEAQEMIEAQRQCTMDRWNGLYKSFVDKSSYVSSKKSGDQFTTFDIPIILGSFVEKRGIEERIIVWNGNNSVTDADDLCNSERGIPGAETAKELLWEVQASCLRAKGEAQETIEEFFSEEEKEKRAAQQLKSVKEFKEVGKACKAAVMASGDHADAFLAYMLSERMRVFPSYVNPEIDPERDDFYMISIEKHNSFDQGETLAEEGRDDPETNFTTLATDIEFVDYVTSFESASDRTPADFPAFASESEESGLDFKQPLSSTLSQDERNVAPLTDRGRTVRGNTEHGKLEDIAALLRRAAPMRSHTGPTEESVATQRKSNLSGNRRRSAGHVSNYEANDNFDFSEDQSGKLAMAAVAKARLEKAKARLQKASIRDPSKSVIDPYRSHHSRTGGRSYGVIRYENPIQHINLVNSQELIDLTMYDDSE